MRGKRVAFSPLVEAKVSPLCQAPVRLAVPPAPSQAEPELRGVDHRAPKATEGRPRNSLPRSLRGGCRGPFQSPPVTCPGRPPAWTWRGSQTSHGTNSP